jgi:hypothetical protein
MPHFVCLDRFSALTLIIHVWLVKEQVGPNLVVNAIDRMEGHDIPFPSQEITQVSGERLAVSGQFVVGDISTDVVVQVLGNVLFGTICEPRRVREWKLGIQKALVATFVLE